MRRPQALVASSPLHTQLCHRVPPQSAAAANKMGHLMIRGIPSISATTIVKDIRVILKLNLTTDWKTFHIQ